MHRRIVRKNSHFEATREANRATTRQFLEGTVLNILQWIRPGEARFTVEGEGAEIWVCEQATLNRFTDELSASRGASV
jgi:hypothetical protein